MRPSSGFPFMRGTVNDSTSSDCGAWPALHWLRSSGTKGRAPAWSQPLPVHCDELNYRLDTTSARKLLLQEFGRSVRHHEWNLRHPPFPDWARTVMACKFTSEIILRSDLEEEFPPKKIVELWGPGKTDPLHWLSPEEAAQDKAFWEFRRLCDNGVSPEDARRISGFRP